MIRIAAVRYLNARPLWEALREDPQLELTLDVPRRCAERLRRGEADVALVPAVELLRDPRLRPLGRSGVAADGAVESVLLLAPCGLDRLEAVVEDPASRTSNALARVLLRERHGLQVPFVAGGAGPRTGRVLIGDAALRAPAAAVRLDLAAEWKGWTGLPFVFARWATAHPSPPAAWTELLERARARGLALRPAIARDAARELGLPAPRLLRYLGERLGYELGPRHEAALRRFAASLSPATQEAA